MMIDPSKTDVPIIGQPRIAGAVATVALLCTCEAHTLLMLQAGNPGQCPTCKAGWVVQAEVKMGVQRLALPGVSE